MAKTVYGELIEFIEPEGSSEPERPATLRVERPVEPRSKLKEESKGSSQDTKVTIQGPIKKG